MLENQVVSTNEIGTIRHWRIDENKRLRVFDMAICLSFGTGRLFTKGFD